MGPTDAETRRHARSHVSYSCEAPAEANMTQTVEQHVGIFNLSKIDDSEAVKLGALSHVGVVDTSGNR